MMLAAAAAGTAGAPKSYRIDGIGKLVVAKGCRKFGARLKSWVSQRVHNDVDFRHNAGNNGEAASERQFRIVYNNAVITRHPYGNVDLRLYDGIGWDTQQNIPCDDDGTCSRYRGAPGIGCKYCHRNGERITHSGTNAPRNRRDGNVGEGTRPAVDSADKVDDGRGKRHCHGDRFRKLGKTGVKYSLCQYDNARRTVGCGADRGSQIITGHYRTPDIFDTIFYVTSMNFVLLYVVELAVLC